MSTNQKVSKYGSVVILVVAGVALFLAQSAYWVNHTIFNQANFSQISNTALLSDSSRDAIATAVVDKALENRPLIKRTVGDRAISITSGLLGSDLSSQALKTLTDKTYAYLTASDRQDIKIDLTGIKTPISKIVSLTQNDDRVQSLTQRQIPDEIVLVRSNAFPDLSGIVRLMLWLGPLLWLSAISLLALYIYLGRAAYAKRVYLAGLVVIIVAVVGILTNPFVPPPVAAAIPNIALRPVAENLTTAFLAPFKVQMYYMLAGALLTLLIFNQRFNILTAIKLLETKLRRKA